MTPARTCGSRRLERGYITLFILGLALAVFLSLGGAMQVSFWIQETNRRQADRIQARAASVPLVGEPDALGR